jgi:hypothetical protein
MKLHRLLFLSLLCCGYTQAEVETGAGVNLNFHRYQRLNQPQFQTRAQDWLGLGIDRGHRLSMSKRLYLKADLRYYREDGHFNYSVPEAYWNYRDRFSELTIGRKVVDWNPGEAYWGLNNGLNPRQGFTLLGQEQEGLTGVHFDRQFGAFKARFFMSYLYIPSLNPSLDIEDGVVKTRSEWVRRPPARTTFRGVPLNIFYKIEIPPVQDIVFKKSLGAALDYSWDTGSLSFFTIYKPENNLRANALVEGIQAEFDRVIIKAEPVVNSHVMIGAHLSQQVANSLFLVGFDITDPNATLGKDFDVLDPVELRETNRIFSTDDFVIEPSYVRESYARASWLSDWGEYRLGMSYIRLMTDNNRGDDFFTDTVKWKSAIGLYGDWTPTDDWLIAGDYKYDLSRKDEILKIEASYFWKPRFQFLLGGELLKAPSRESYWSFYRANDTIYARASLFF